MITFEQLLDVMQVMNHSTWYKDFLPLIAAIFGVISGLFLNSIKDLVINRVKRNKYKKLIEEELSFALEEALGLAHRVCKAIDTFQVQGNGEPWTYVGDISIVCYEEYYSKVIENYDSKQRKSIHQAYSQINFINSRATMVTTNRVSDGVAISVGNMNDLMIAIMKLYHAYINLYRNEELEHMSFELFLERTGIQSRFYSAMVEKSKNENQ